MATGISFQKRREYVHVGSCATSLSRTVLKRYTGVRAQKSNRYFQKLTFKIEAGKGLFKKLL